MTRYFAQSIFVLILISGSLSANASEWLNFGAEPSLLHGSTYAGEPDLGGVVQTDDLLPIVIKGAGGNLLFKGQLQFRISRSSTNGFLHFSLRIRDTQAGLPGIVRRVQMSDFTAPSLIYADWRPDGLGTIAPNTAQRSAYPGALVTFDFTTPLAGGQESRFFFLKCSTDETRPGGKVTITLRTGESVVIPTSQSPQF